MACVVVRRREGKGRRGRVLLRALFFESLAFQGTLLGCPQEECWILGPLQDRTLGDGAHCPHHRRRGCVCGI